MEKLTYSDASINDLPAIVEIYNSTIPSRKSTADLEPVTVESRINWFNQHEPNRRPLWIVESGNKNLVGWISFQSFYGRPAYNATAEISIYLDQHSRGKGYGKQLLDYATSQCPSMNIKTLLGYIFAHNEPSLKLFYSCGFEDWAMLPGIAEMDGVERSLKILGRRI